MRAPILRGRLLLSIGIGVALLLAAQIAQGSSATSIQIATHRATSIRICNSGNTTFRVARLTSAGYWSFGEKNTWRYNGWWEVKPGLFSCENFDYGGYDGYYYFGFAIMGKNGVRSISPRVADSWLGFENTNKKFCVGPKFKSLEGTAPLSHFEDLDYCPSGWILAPFSIGLSAVGRRYKLELNVDSWAKAD